MTIIQNNEGWFKSSKPEKRSEMDMIRGDVSSPSEIEKVLLDMSQDQTD